jgi:thiamine biosynthesis lipoprotein
MNRSGHIIKGRIAAWLLLAVIAGGCNVNPPASIYHESRLLMGTLVEIKLVASTPGSAKAAFEAAFLEFGRIERLMSFQSASSELERINQAAGGEPVVVSSELLRLIRQAKHYAEVTNGAFDISVGPLIKLWGFDNEQHRLPEAEEINKALPLVDFSAIITSEQPPAVKLTRAGMSLDLGAIAKGYAVDRALEILRRQGITAAIVNAGGDVKAMGKKPDGRRWNIGIAHPRQSGRILASLRVDNQAVVTSGDYERFFIEQGVRYHHILDPKSGRPARGCQSVTVVAEKALAADALATGIFVLGPEKGLELIERLPDAEALIVDADGMLSISSGLKGKLDFNH